VGVAAAAALAFSAAYTRLGGGGGANDSANGSRELSLFGPVNWKVSVEAPEAPVIEISVMYSILPSSSLLEASLMVFLER